jgi:hypothetical protein
MLSRAQTWGVCVRDRGLIELGVRVVEYMLSCDSGDENLYKWLEKSLARDRHERRLHAWSYKG